MVYSIDLNTKSRVLTYKSNKIENDSILTNEILFIFALII